ncbi:MAG TPA: FAD-dependent oxidoreductase [Gaiellaceae bacterium]|nr:FAD-dependent oxidoreductase [Gaiellaceae bacterium]
MAGALGIAHALHATALQQPPRPAVSGRSGGLSDPRRGDRIPGAVRGDVRAPCRAEQPGADARSRGRPVRPRGGRQNAHGRSGRGRYRPVSDPHVPDVAGRLGPDVFQTHSTGYRKPSDVPQAGTVLVVGGGNTGFQIAKELSVTHEVVLSVGSRQTPLPQRFLGRDLFWWLTKSRLFDTTVESRLGRKLRHRETLIGSSPRELRRRYGVDLRQRVVDADGRTVRFEDGSELDVDAVIWATGYRPDYSWIDLPVFDENGRLRHRRGVTDVPGLYFLGLTWQHTRGSALIGWVKDDAQFIAGEIETLQEAPGAPVEPGRAAERRRERV